MLTKTNPEHLETTEFDIDSSYLTMTSDELNNKRNAILDLIADTQSKIVDLDGARQISSEEKAQLEFENFRRKQAIERYQKVADELRIAMDLRDAVNRAKESLPTDTIPTSKHREPSVVSSDEDIRTATLAELLDLRIKLNNPRLDEQQRTEILSKIQEKEQIIEDLPELPASAYVTQY